MPVMTQDLIDAGMTPDQIKQMEAENERIDQENRRVAAEIQARAAKVAELEKQLASAQAADKARIQEKISAIVETPADKPLPIAARLPPLPEGAAKMGLTALGLLGAIGVGYLLFRSPPKKGAGIGGKPLAKAGDYRRNHRFTRRWYY